MAPVARTSWPARSLAVFSLLALALGTAHGRRSYWYCSPRGVSGYHREFSDLLWKQIVYWNSGDRSLNCNTGRLGWMIRRMERQHQSCLDAASATKSFQSYKLYLTLERQLYHEEYTRIAQWACSTPGTATWNRGLIERPSRSLGRVIVLAYRRFILARRVDWRSRISTDTSKLKWFCRLASRVQLEWEDYLRAMPLGFRSYFQILDPLVQEATHVICPEQYCNIRDAEICADHAFAVKVDLEKDWKPAKRWDMCNALKNSIACMIAETLKCSPVIYASVADQHDRLMQLYHKHFLCDSIVEDEDVCTAPSLAQEADGPMNVTYNVDLMDLADQYNAALDIFDSDRLCNDLVSTAPAHIANNVSCQAQDPDTCGVADIIKSCADTPRYCSTHRIVVGCAESTLLKRRCSPEQKLAVLGFYQAELLKYPHCVNTSWDLAGPGFGTEAEEIVECFSPDDSYTLCNDPNNTMQCLASVNASIEYHQHFIEYMRLYHDIICLQNPSQPDCFETNLYLVTRDIMVAFADQDFCNLTTSLRDAFNRQRDCQKAILQPGITKVLSTLDRMDQLMCNPWNRTGCDLEEAESCYMDVAPMKTISEEDVHELTRCVETATAQCWEGSSRLSDLVLWVNQTGEILLSSPTSNSSSAKDDDDPPASQKVCGCSPSEAVNCVMDLNHMLKQPVPDWNHLCDSYEIDLAYDCASQLMLGCDQETKQSVYEIITKLANEVAEGCRRPPFSNACDSVKALKCSDEVTEVMKSEEDFPHFMTCGYGVFGQRCVYENVLGCADETTLTVVTRFAEAERLFNRSACGEERYVEYDCVGKSFGDALFIQSHRVKKVLRQVANNDSRPIDLERYFDTCDNLEYQRLCGNFIASQKYNRSSVTYFNTILGYSQSLCKKARGNPNPPMCYECDGTVDKPCLSANQTTVQCQFGEVCQTVSSVVGTKYTLVSKGCERNEKCDPFCYKGLCTFCCDDNLCNSVVNGPVDGACDTDAILDCLKPVNNELSDNGYIECRTAETAQACIDDAQKDCELGGLDDLSEFIENLGLEELIEECRMEEAKKAACTGESVLAAWSYVQAFSTNIDRSFVCEFRIGLRKGSETLSACTEAEVNAIVKSTRDLDVALGYLDCGNLNLVDINCRTGEAVSCIQSVLNVTEWDQVANLTCSQLSAIESCMASHTTGCSRATQFTLLAWKQDWLMARLEEGAMCPEFNLTRPEARMFDVYNCSRRFSTKLAEDPVKYLYKATMMQKECLNDLDLDSHTNSSSLSRKSVDSYIASVQTVISWKDEIEAVEALKFTVDECEAAVGDAISKHANLIYALPYVSIDQRETVCGWLDRDVKELESSCGESVDLEPVIALLDITRSELIVKYCPNVQPLFRCNFKQAEQCLDSFHTRFDVLASDLCSEADEFLHCVQAYTTDCYLSDNDKLRKFQDSASFALTFVAQACSEDIELAARARCYLESGARPQCSTAILDMCLYEISANDTACSKSFSSFDCEEDHLSTCPEKKTTYNTTTYQECLDNATRGGDLDIAVTRQCSEPAYSCNISTTFSECLQPWTEGMEYNSTNMDITKECLKTHYNCFGSIRSAARSGFPDDWILQSFTPGTTGSRRMESRFFEIWLREYDLFQPIVDLRTNNRMRLYNLCYLFEKFFTKAYRSLAYAPPSLPGIPRSLKRAETAVQVLCNDPGLSNVDLNFFTTVGCTIKRETFIWMSHYVITTAFFQMYQLDWETYTICEDLEMLEILLDQARREGCSQGAITETEFTMNLVEAMFAGRCDEPVNDDVDGDIRKETRIKQCSVEKVEGCVREVYNVHRQLGLNFTSTELCVQLETMDRCVDTYSFKCDDTKAARIDWLQSSARGVAQRFCPALQPYPPCGMDPEDAACKPGKACYCSLGAMRAVVDPYMSHSFRCRSLASNKKCMNLTLDFCPANGTSSTRFLATDEDYHDTAMDLGCTPADLDLRVGCEPGCDLHKADLCFDEFESGMEFYSWEVLNDGTCSLINKLRTCIEESTNLCKAGVADRVNARYTATLAPFTDYDQTCVDYLRCARRFNQLAAQILGLPKEGEERGPDVQSLEDTNGLGGDSLSALCTAALERWRCLNNSFMSMSGSRRVNLEKMYRDIWERVEDKCSDTRDLECYICVDEAEQRACVTKTQICNIDKRACFRSTNVTGAVRYSAGCRRPESCGVFDRNGYCCDDKNCNNAQAIKDAYRPCDQRESLQCALDFSLEYYRMEDFDCKSSVKQLSCVQDKAPECAKDLADSASEVLISLGDQGCAIGEEDKDSECVSPALEAALILIADPHSSVGDGICHIVADAEKCVQDVLDSDKLCSPVEASRLRNSLTFLKATAGAQCKWHLCQGKGEAEDSSEMGCPVDFWAALQDYFLGVDFAYQNSGCHSAFYHYYKVHYSFEHCNMTGFVMDEIDNLLNVIERKCGPSDFIIPQLECPGLCDGLSVFDMAHEVYDPAEYLKTLDVYRIEKTYDAMAVDCTSVQQRALVWGVGQILPYSVDFKVKQDVYSPLHQCRDNFFSSFIEAFENEEPEHLCHAFKALKDCDYSLPYALDQHVGKDMHDLINLLEPLDLCGPNVSLSGQTTCSYASFVRTIKRYEKIPDIAYAGIAVRGDLCRFAKEEYNKRVSCTSNTTDVMLESMELLSRHMGNSMAEACQEGFFDKSDCNAVPGCLSEFLTLSAFADIDKGLLCGPAQFGLQCVGDHLWSCPNSESHWEVLEAASTLVHGVLGDSCTNLNPYLFCYKDLVSADGPTCRTKEGQNCIDDYVDNYWKKPSGYCGVMNETYQCAKDALDGCTHQQLTEVDFTNLHMTGRKPCGLPEFTNQSICIAGPDCPTDSLSTCLYGTVASDCQSFEAAVNCTNAVLAEHDCGYSLQALYLVEKSRLFYADLNCPQAPSIDLKRSAVFNDSAIQELLTNSERVALTLYSPTDELMKAYKDLMDGYIVDRLNTTALDVFNYGLHTTVQLPINPYSSSTNDWASLKTTQVKDTEDCNYVRAASCVFYGLLEFYSAPLLTQKEKQDFCDMTQNDGLQACVKKSLSGTCDHYLHYKDMAKEVEEWQHQTDRCGAEISTCSVSGLRHCNEAFSRELGDCQKGLEEERVCGARHELESCAEDFSEKCDPSFQRANYQLEDARRLQHLVADLCEDFDKPAPPICPDIPQRNRYCNYGNAFLCLAKFNMRLFSAGDALAWHEQCMSMQSMFTCVATNTTSCDPEDENVVTIIGSLDDLRDQAAFNCPWLSEDMCVEEDPCPSADYHCENDVEVALFAGTDICNVLKMNARNCIYGTTLTCTAAQKHQTERIVNEKFEAYGIPRELNCTNQFDNLITSFFWSASQLPRGVGPCQAFKPILDAIIASPVGSQSTVFADWATSHVVAGIYEDLCDVWSADTSTCDDTLMIYETDVVNDYFFHLAFDPHLDNNTFCTMTEKVLALTCYNNVTQTIIAASSPYSDLCTKKPLGCGQASRLYTACISSASGTTPCNETKVIAECLSKYITVECLSAVPLTEGPACEVDGAFIVVAELFKSTPTNVRYISEAGPTTIDYALTLIDGSYPNVRVDISFRPKHPQHVPICLMGPEKGSAIPQVVVHSDNYIMLAPGEEKKFTVEAVQDYRTDGVQEIEVIFTVTPVNITGNETELLKDYSFKMEPHTLVVGDRDQPLSTCSSVNDPHIRTFDQVNYDNWLVGESILYRNTKYPAAVTATFVQCAKYGTCNCAVTVYGGDSFYRFDVCDGWTNMISELTPRAGDLSSQALQVSMHEDSRTYDVLILLTGTLVTIKHTGNYLNVWIMPSNKDFGVSQGLCGNYDGKAYTDLQRPNFGFQTVAKSDYQSGVFVPQTFSTTYLGDYTDDNVFLNGQNKTNNTPEVTCNSWYQGDGNWNSCGTDRQFATCGYITGDDITQALMDEFRQASVASRRRRSVDLAGEPIDHSKAKFPTASGITQKQAEDFCYKSLNDPTMESCRDTLASIDKDYSLPSQVTQCVEDIRRSDTLSDWVTATKESMAQRCMIEILTQAGYMDSEATNAKATAYFDAMCSPHDCNGHGKCVQGVCQCSGQYVGSACDIPESALTTPPTVFEESSVCAKGETSSCTSVFVRGNGFISSKWMRCHLREVLENGEVAKDETKVKAFLMSSGVVRCVLDDNREHKRTLQVSVSNDGVRPSERAHVFMVYDPNCYSCEDMDTCTRRPNVCLIGQTCVAEGEVSIYEECLYCSLDKPTEWSIFKERVECQHLVPEEYKSDDEDDKVYIGLITAGAAVAVLLVVVIVGVCLYIKRARSKRSEAEERASLSFPSNSLERQHPPAYTGPYFYFQKGSRDSSSSPDKESSLPSTTESEWYAEDDDDSDSVTQT